MTIPFGRTPDGRFTNLPDFPYAPSYVEVEGRPVHAGMFLLRQPHRTFASGGHFLPDDCGEAVVQAVLDRMTPPTKGD